MDKMTNAQLYAAFIYAYSLNPCWWQEGNNYTWEDFVADSDHSFTTGRYNTQADGWTSEFRIEVGAFYFKYTAYEDGRFGGDVDFIYSKLPSNEDLLK